MRTPTPIDRTRFATDYNWEEVFKYGDKPTHVIPERRALAPERTFSLTDVSEFYHFVDGENDESEWVCVGVLKDGRYFAINAGCDYTGWGCQEGGESAIADTYEDIVRLGLSDEERARLAIVLP